MDSLALTGVRAICYLLARSFKQFLEVPADAAITLCYGKEEQSFCNPYLKMLAVHQFYIHQTQLFCVYTTGQAEHPLQPPTLPMLS